MKVYIFGAGASKGSQGNYASSVKAPLINEIFNESYAGFAEGVGLSRNELKYIEEQVIAAGLSVEEWLTRRWDLIKSIKTVPSRHAEQKFFGRITCYLWWMFQNVSMHRGTDIYGEFVRRVLRQDEEFAFINFNYDTLLDKAYQSQRGAVLQANIESYLKVNYIKPHGSVNWVLNRRSTDPSTSGIDSSDHLVRYETASSSIFRDAEPLSFSSLKIIDPLVRQLQSLKFITEPFYVGEYCYPLIFLPLSSKMFDHVQGFSEAVIEKGNELMAKANDIYLIGYRGQDATFEELYRKAPDEAKLHVVTLGDPKEIVDRAVNVRGRIEVVETNPRGFEDFVGSM